VSAILALSSVSRLTRLVRERRKKFILNVSHALFIRAVHVPLPHFLAQVCWSCLSPTHWSPRYSWQCSSQPSMERSLPCVSLFRWSWFAYTDVDVGHCVQVTMLFLRSSSDPLVVIDLGEIDQIVLNIRCCLWNQTVIVINYQRLDPRQ